MRASALSLSVLRCRSWSQSPKTRAFYRTTCIPWKNGKIRAWQAQIQDKILPLLSPAPPLSLSHKWWKRKVPDQKSDQGGWVSFAPFSPGGSKSPLALSHNTNATTPLTHLTPTPKLCLISNWETTISYKTNLRSNRHSTITKWLQGLDKKLKQRLQLALGAIGCRIEG